MPERFARDTREKVRRAAELAEAENASMVEVEHLLSALVDPITDSLGQHLNTAGLSAPAIRAARDRESTPRSRSSASTPTDRRRAQHPANGEAEPRVSVRQQNFRWNERSRSPLKVDNDESPPPFSPPPPPPPPSEPTSALCPDSSTSSAPTATTSNSCYWVPYDNPIDLSLTSIIEPPVGHTTEFR